MDASEPSLHGMLLFLSRSRRAVTVVDDNDRRCDDREERKRLCRQNPATELCVIQQEVQM